MIVAVMQYSLSKRSCVDILEIVNNQHSLLHSVVLFFVGLAM